MMTPEMQLIFNIVAGIAGFFGSVVLRTQLTTIKDVQSDHARLAQKLAEIEILVAGNYVKRSDLDQMVSAIFAKLDRMETKLDNKADKS